MPAKRLPPTKLPLAFVLLFSLLLTIVPAASSKQTIFSLSQVQQTSNLLGATGVCAYVVARGKTRKGFYITAVTPEGIWRLVGLQPGDLLIGIDKETIQDAATADNAISKTAGALRTVLFVRPQEDGTPRFVKARVPLPALDVLDSPQTQAAELPAGFDSAKEQPQSKDRDGDGNRRSITSLEAYAGNLINKDRHRDGSAPISMNSALSQLARDYAQYLIDHGTFAHIDLQGRDPQVRARLHGISPGVYENLAYQTYGLGDERQMIDRCEAQMMAEPRGQKNHRSNIVAQSHCCMGVGIARNADRLVMVHEFTDESP